MSLLCCRPPVNQSDCRTRFVVSYVGAAATGDTSVAPFCAAVRVPGGKLPTGGQHELSIWLRASDALRTLNVSLALYYEASVDVDGNDAASNSSGSTDGQLAYRVQRIAAHVEVLPSFSVTHALGARSGVPADRLLRVRAENVWPDGVMRLRAVAAHSQHWRLSRAAMPLM